MPDYQKGKIYKIWDSGYNKCYIGSTAQELSVRMAGHRQKYKMYKKKTYQYITSFTLFDEYGVDNCKIELLELYPCLCKAELLAREGHHQRETECLNKCIADRKRSQWYQDNRDTNLQKGKSYRENNVEKERERHKISYEENKEKVLQRWKSYKEKTKTK